MDNFDDFTPNTKGASKLASLFGENKGANDSSSLTYTAPKQPKTTDSPSRTITSEPVIVANPNPKMEIITTNLVHAFKLLNGAYQPLGMLGLTLAGCENPPLYQLLLYKTKTDVTCKTRISPSFVFTVMDNNYASFYSEDQQNYSVMFKSSSELQSFTQQILTAKAYLTPQLTAIFQDTKFCNGLEALDGACVNITAFSLQSMSSPPVLIEEDFQIVLGSGIKFPWLTHLTGLKLGAERAIILGKELSDPWKEKLPPESKLLLIGRVAEQSARAEVDESSLVESSIESADDSSSFKEKGAMIEGVLSGKSHKSGLLSRVARLGQATLPLRGAVVADITDSEEDSPSPKPRIRAKPPTSIVPPSKSFQKPQNIRQEHQREIIDAQSFPQPLALYQPPLHSQIIVQRNDGVSLLGNTNSNLASPSDVNLSVHFSESRTQAAELRMGISKVTDKVDLVLDKVQTLIMRDQQPAPQNVIPPALDPSGLLASITALVQENQKLKSEVEEQKHKVDTLNERIFHLLELSQKSLEQKSNSIENQFGQQEKEKLLRENEKLSHNLSNSNSQISDLREENKTLQSKVEESEEKIKNLSSSLASCESEKTKLENELKLGKKTIETLENNLEKLTTEKYLVLENQKELNEQVEELKKQIQEKVSLMETQLNNANYGEQETKLKLEIETLKNECEILKNSKIEMEKKISDLLSKNLKMDEIKMVNNNLKENIAEKENSLEKLQRRLSKLEGSRNVEQNGGDTKTLMNTVYRNLHSQFNADGEYSGAAIKQVLAAVIRDMTLEFLEKNESRPIEKAENDSIVKQPVEQSPPHIESKETSQNLSSVSFSPDNAPLTSSTTSPVSVTSPGEQSIGDSGAQSILDCPSSQPIVDKQSYNQIWHDSEPPPLPAFDEDEDEENVW